MTDLFQKENYLVCPHTATSVIAVNALKMAPETTVCLATAHPAKFEEAIALSLSANNQEVPKRPKELEELFSLPTRKVLLPNALQDIQAFILKKLPIAMRERSQECEEEESDWSDSLSFVNILLAASVVAILSFAVTRYSKK